MKILMESWREFLNESVEADGILKIGLSAGNTTEAEAMQSMLPEEAIRLKGEDLHVTLVHQSILKPFQENIKNIDLPIPPPIVLEDDVWDRDSMGKKSWAVRLKNQDDMRSYVQQVMELLGSQNTNPEPERVFHVSLANLTGNPMDSVR